MKSKTAHLGKIVKNGRVLIIAMDQGLEHGPTDFNERNINPEYVLDVAARGGFTGLACDNIYTTGGISTGSASRTISLFAPATSSSYLVTIRGNDSTQYMGTFMVFCQGDGSINGTEVVNMNNDYSLTSSGANVQITLSGGDGTVYWSALRLG